MAVMSNFGKVSVGVGKTLQVVDGQKYVTLQAEYDAYKISSQAAFDASMNELQGEFDSYKTTIQAEHEAEVNAMQTAFDASIAAIQDEIVSLSERVTQYKFFADAVTRTGGADYDAGSRKFDVPNGKYTVPDDASSLGLGWNNGKSTYAYNFLDLFNIESITEINTNKLKNIWGIGTNPNGTASGSEMIFRNYTNLQKLVFPNLENLWRSSGLDLPDSVTHIDFQKDLTVVPHASSQNKIYLNCTRSQNIRLNYLNLHNFTEYFPVSTRQDYSAFRFANATVNVQSLKRFPDYYVWLFFYEGTTVFHFRDLRTCSDGYQQWKAEGAQAYAIIDNIIPPSANYNRFFYIFDRIYVPDEAVDTYKNATNWNARQDKIYPMSEFTPS